MDAPSNGDVALPERVDELIQALEAIHNPRSSNEVRHSATSWLEEAKQSPHALAHGFALAVDPSRATIVRHFGLSMMAFHLKYIYSGNSDEMLRDYVLRLTDSIRETDPPFLRNKFAQIWTEVAKRIWGRTWTDMDEQLVKLWGASYVHQEFVLTVLETLSDDIFHHDDYIAGMRQELGTSLSRIFLPEEAFLSWEKLEQFTPMRFAGEGWMMRLCRFLKHCLDQKQDQNPMVYSCTLKILAVLNSVCSWILPKALVSSYCIEGLKFTLIEGDTRIRIAALETLCSIFSRNTLDSVTLTTLLEPMFTAETLNMLHDAYQWAGTSPDDDDDQKYAFVKKLSELLTLIGTDSEQNPSVLASSGNVGVFFRLVLEITKHPSLVVSLPLLQLWAKIMRTHKPEYLAVIEELFGPLLQLCSERSIRYDVLPEDSGDPSLAFLAIDCDNPTQRDLVVQQFRSSVIAIIEQIVRKVPLEAVRHIIEKAATYFHELESASFDPQTYSKMSFQSFTADSYLTTVEAGTRGCLKWLATNIDNVDEPEPGMEEQGDELRRTLADWCESSVTLKIQDPDIKRKMIVQAVSITTKLLPDHTNTALKVLDTLLSIRSEKIPSTPHYQEISKELVETCAFGGQRLATVFADRFLSIYDQLESRVQEIVAAEGDDLQPRWFSFLVMIIHRASNLSSDLRMEKLRRMIMPIKDQWENPELNQAATSFDTFCRYVGWDQLPVFLASNNFDKVGNWSEQPMTQEAKDFQAEILRRNDLVPIKLTKALLHATTEKLDEHSPTLAIASTVWQEIMPAILPNILKMLSYATDFQNPARWSSYPQDVQKSMQRLLQDRFWQNGISNESRDAFVSRVSNSKNTFEGFGSTVRRTIRQIRVGSCDLLTLFAKFGEPFWAIPDLGEPLGNSMFEHSEVLSAHHFSVLITFASHLIHMCPSRRRQQVLPPVLTRLFTVMRFKVESEWEAVNRRTDQSSADDNLDDEMKNQSILRSMTYNGCYLLFSMLENHHQLIRARRTAAGGQSGQVANDIPGLDEIVSESFFNVITTNTTVLEPVILFMNSALRVRDTQSVGCIISALRGLLPVFEQTGPPHEFLCNDILKSVITSLHEPYYVDLQKDLAGFIVRIIHVDAELSAKVISSLPGLSQQPDKVMVALARVRASPSEKVARAVVLDLLEQIRGVSIHEMGRIGGPKKSRTAARLLAQLEAQMNPTATHPQPTVVKIERGGSPALDGMASLLEG